MQFVKVEDIYVHSKVGSTKERIENDKYITKQYKPSNLEEHKLYLTQSESLKEQL